MLPGMELCTRCRKEAAEPGTKACVKCRAREKRYEQAKQARVEGTGLCKRCEENERLPGRVWCGGCASYMQEAREAHRRKPKPPGSCSRTDCTNLAETGYRLCSSCRAKSEEYERNNRTEIQFRARQTRRRLRLLAFDHYGGPHCSCCGEAEYEFLTIDHINGDGAEYRRRMGSKRDIYRWLKQNNYPPGFRVLCMNCNFALGYHGYCPHHGWTQPTRNGRRGRPAKA